MRRKTYEITPHGTVVNKLPTHVREGEKVEGSYNQVVEIEVGGKALWNFFAFRGFLIHQLEEKVKKGLYSPEKYKRFLVAVDHCRTHGALQFVAEGFDIRVVPVKAQHEPFLGRDSSADDGEE